MNFEFDEAIERTKRFPRRAPREVFRDSGNHLSSTCWNPSSKCGCFVCENFFKSVCEGEPGQLPICPRANKFSPIVCQTATPGSFSRSETASNSRGVCVPRGDILLLDSVCICDMQRSER